MGAYRDGVMRRAARWLQANPLAADALLAAALTLFIAPLMMSTNPSSTPGLLMSTGWTSLALWSLTSAAPLTMRRWRPEPAAWLFVGLTIAHLLVGPVITFGDFLAPIMLYTVLAHGSPAHTRRFVVAALSLCGVASLIWSVAINIGPLLPLASQALARNIPWELWLPAVVAMPTCPALVEGAGQSYATMCGGKVLLDAGTMLVPMIMVSLSVIVMGVWRRSRLATMRAISERNALLVAREGEERRIAALAERARIARDMHDVVAHTLSTIIIQSDGGRYAGARDPAVARSTMLTIRREAERAQHDMRRLFGTVGADGSAGYHGVAALVREAQLPASRQVTGHPRPELLSPLADEALYRLVQEALSNARKYAGPGATVRIDEIWSDDGVSLTVCDDGLGEAATRDGHRAGFGLIGMRERVEAAGGTLSAGPRPNGGFLVAAMLPYARPGQADAPDQSEYDAPTESKPSIPVAITARLQEALAALRSKRFDQGEDGGSNVIERLARWTERHYLLMDLLEALALALLFYSTTLKEFALVNAPYDPQGVQHAMATLTIVIATAPLIFRRRFPESSALAMAVFSALQLLLLPSVMLVNVLALVSVYSAVLYGRDKAWRWVVAALAADSWLFGIKAMANWNGFGSLAQMLLGLGPAGDGTGRMAVVMAGIGPALIVAVMGLGCVALALWTRSSGANALVLAQREEALKAERERVKVLSANLERDRIGAAIQAEVAATLDAVIARANAGLAMFDTADDEPDVAAAFEAIGRQGRDALAHMRQLLGVLRQTGFSDEAHAAGPNLALAPAASLDQQLRRNPGHAQPNR